MNRRTFLTSTGILGCASAASLTGLEAAAAAGGGEGRQYLELRRYTLATEGQRDGLHRYWKEAAIPALRRAGIEPVGVFQDAKAMSPVYVLIPHSSASSAIELDHRLLADADYVARGGWFLEAVKAEQPYEELESWLLLAFKGMPTVERPVSNPGRIFQLRIYESPSFQTGQKKIEMFNDAGELRIFREVGLAPVFFGEALFGTKMPNLTYMLGFESGQALKDAWGRFGRHPDWQELRVRPEYADNRILRNIINVQLVPAEYSQI
jgi:hypothetical protein